MKNKVMESIFLIVFIVMFIACLANVKAFAVTPPYRPVLIFPGNTTEVGIGLQNMVGDEDITLVAEIIEGDDIAEIIDESNEYFVPFGSKGEVIDHIRITIPADDPVGKNYTVGLTLTTVTPGEAGAVAMGSSIGTEFSVVVASPTAPAGEEKAFQYIIWLWLVVIVIIIWLLIRKKSKTKK